MQVYFTVNVEESFGTLAGVHLIEDVRLIWGPLNTVFTVVFMRRNLLFTIFKYLFSFQRYSSL